MHPARQLLLPVVPKYEKKIVGDHFQTRDKMYLFGRRGTYLWRRYAVYAIMQDLVV